MGYPIDPADAQALRDSLDAWRAKALLLETWLPTTGAVAALPAGIREYIVALETRCDPAGEITRRLRREWFARGESDIVRMLLDENDGLRRDLDKLGVVAEVVAKAADVPDLGVTAVTDRR